MSGHVVTIGEVLSVFLGEPDTPLDAAIRFERHFAGAESNVAIGLARQGVPVSFFGRISTDALGQAAWRHLRGEGINLESTIRDTAPSGMLVRNVAGASVVEVIYGRSGSAGARLSPADISENVIATASAVHFSGITPMLSLDAAAACTLACDIAAAYNVPISFDPNLRLRMAPLNEWRLRLEPFLNRADLIFTGVDEAMQLSDRNDLASATKWLHEKPAKVIVLKDGAKGARGWDGERWHEAPPVPVVAIDPVGAGDAFNAGFLASWLDSHDISDALRAGARLGSATVAARGDTTGIPDLRRGFAASRDVLR